jgi:hypothetical protein
MTQETLPGSITIKAINTPKGQIVITETDNQYENNCRK